MGRLQEKYFSKQLTLKTRRFYKVYMYKVKNILFLLSFLSAFFLKNNSYSQMSVVMDNDTSITCQIIDFSGSIGELRAIKTDRSLRIIKSQDIVECYYPSQAKFPYEKIREYEKKIMMLLEEQKQLTEKKNDLQNTRDMYEIGLQNMESDEDPVMGQGSD